MTQNYEADFVILGAGSAGCVLASRLSADPQNRVLLIEAGGSDRSLFIQMPTALSIPMNMAKYNWQFESEPEPFMDQRRLHCPRGKVLGGSSSINGMVYVRGHACDFEEWAAAGATGWDYRNCLPYFRKAENWIAGGDDYRGDDGPLHTNAGNDMANPLYRAFVSAGVEAGYGHTGDYNGFRQEGFGPLHMTVKDGVRWSTANAYLKPARGRANLQVLSRALIDKIEFQGSRAVAITFHHNGQAKRASASREIILSAGSIGSPTILQRSGIGPARVLAAAGITPLMDLPGVGENLQDHLEVYFQFHCRAPITLNGQLDPLHKLLIGARWFFLKSGLGATNHFEAGAFIRSRAGIKWPDIQYHFLPAAMSYDGRSAVKGHGFQVHVGPNKPKSRGHVRITSAQAAEKPQIQFNYMQAEEDRTAFRAAIRLTREIMSQPALAPYNDGEIQPGTEISGDSEIDAWIRANAESAYHPSCTCKIGGDDDPTAVLDAACRVRGFGNLRVVDSSIFPTITNGNVNAPTIMVAEKASDMILAKAPLPASNAPYWLHPEWQTVQR